jgi:plasmid maintenance system antidote protein VapI
MPQEADNFSFADPTAMWKQWQDTWGTYYESSAKMWSTMLEESKQAAAKGQFVPPDPFTFLQQWYDAASKTWEQASGNILGREQFMKAASEFLEQYARFFTTLRQNNEEYLKNILLPTRSDLTGIAELIVALEEKVDRVDDAMLNLQQKVDHVDGSLQSLQKDDLLQSLQQKVDHIDNSMESLQERTAQQVTGESFHALEARFGSMEQNLANLSENIDTSQQRSEIGTLHERLEQVESKVDQLLTALANLDSRERELPAVSEIPKAPRRRAPKGEQRDSAEPPTG